MEEYFARQRRRRLIVLAAVLAAALVIFLVVMFAKFRAHSNYRFQSISDFFYQTIIGSEKLEYEFVDQNVSETQIGPYTIRTMSIRLGEETKLVQAVAVPSLFGTYYLFPSLHAATRIGDRQTLSGSEMTYYTQIMLMPLKGGALLHIVSNQEYTEYKGDWNMQRNAGGIYADGTGQSDRFHTRTGRYGLSEVLMRQPVKDETFIFSRSPQKPTERK